MKTLAEGRLDYRPATHETTDGKWIFAASALPREHRRIYAKTIVDPNRSTPAGDERIAGWHPVRLPLAGQAKPRPSIADSGRRLNLYWLDSHVHSALSGDAEGEPDEILHYARDRSKLDVVVMQENDDMYDVPLTESEYATGLGLARWASARGGLLALPGFEWTQILPTGDADPARPTFWQGSFRNHRPVIYPLTGGPLVRYTEAGNDINRLYDAVRRAGGVVHTQHETFVLSQEREVEPAIEVTAGWGIYILTPGRIHQALNDGYRAAFAGTSGSHRRNPGLGGGLTGVYAEDLSDRKILEAYRDRRIFATSGSRVMVEARLNGVLMGRDVPVRDAVKVTLPSHPVRSAGWCSSQTEKSSRRSAANRAQRSIFPTRNPDPEPARTGITGAWNSKVPARTTGGTPRRPKATSRGRRRFGPCAFRSVPAAFTARSNHHRSRSPGP